LTAAVDWAATWRLLIGAVHHAGMGALTWALTQPRWTESTVRCGPNRYQLIWTIRARSNGAG